MPTPATGSFRSLRVSSPFLLLLFLAVAASAQTSAARTSAAERFHQLLDAHWEHGLEANPLEATQLGRHEYDALMPNASMAALEADHQMKKSFLAQLAAIDRKALGAQDRVSYDVFHWMLESDVADFEAGGYLMFLTADWGFHVGLVTLGDEMPLADADGYRDYIARLGAFPQYFDQQI